MMTLVVGIIMNYTGMQVRSLGWQDRDSRYKGIVRK